MFSNDTAADVKGDFRDLIAEGLDPGQATARLVAEYGVGSDPDIDNDFWLALAVTGHKIGRLTEATLTAAIRIIDDPAELARWPEPSRRQRRVALEKVRAVLAEPQPEPKRLRPRAKVDTALSPGQHVQFSLGNGKPDVLFRVLDVHQDKGGRYPVLLALEWDGSPKKARKAHRLDALPGGVDSLRKRPVALGFTACGRPTDPPDLTVLDVTSDSRTPRIGLDYHQYVVAWADMHKFFTAAGVAAIPPEPG